MLLLGISWFCLGLRKVCERCIFDENLRSMMTFTASPQFRRRAIASLSNLIVPQAVSEPLVFPYRQKARLRVGLSQPGGGKPHWFTFASLTYGTPLDVALATAQREMLDTELFYEVCD